MNCVFLFVSMKRMEEERAVKEANQQKYREEVSKIENMLETAKNDLFNLKSDLMRQKEEQEAQLKAEIAQLNENLSRRLFFCLLRS